MNIKRCVIIGGADITQYGRIRARLSAEDFYICCDSGLKHRTGLGITPNLIVGDFDSYAAPASDIETIVLPREKDDTDTVFAVKEALSRGFQEFLLVGVIGGRLDHTLGNVSLLLMLDSLGKQAIMLDDFSELQIVSNRPAEIDGRFAYFSLLNITGTAQGITIKQAKFPLNGAEITCEYQYGISNEVLPGETAQVTVERGRLLLVKVFP